MNLGSLKEDSWALDNFTWTVLHEFGHAFGSLVYEHHGPAANCQWIEEKVLADIRKHYDWSTIETRAEILNSDITAKAHTDFDPKSIIQGRA